MFVSMGKLFFFLFFFFLVRVTCGGGNRGEGGQGGGGVLCLCLCVCYGEMCEERAEIACGVVVCVGLTSWGGGGERGGGELVGK